MFQLSTLNYPAYRLALTTNDPVAFDAWLSAGMPMDLPWILDVSTHAGHVDVCEFIRIGRNHGVKFIGVLGAGGGALGQANAMGIAGFPAAAGMVADVVEAAPSPTPEAPIISGAKIVEAPVRGGQQIWAQGQDLILLGPVSAGAEVMADGNVHCYGVVRGRVAAGVSGNTEARIFVHKLEAQLVSVAGTFQNESQFADSEFWGAQVQITLNGQQLQFKTLP